MDDLLDQITGGDHSRVLFQLTQVGCARRLSRGAGGGWARGEGRPGALLPALAFYVHLFLSPVSRLYEKPVRPSPLAAHPASLASGFLRAGAGDFPSVLSFALRISLSVSHSVGLLTEFARLSFV